MIEDPKAIRFANEGIRPTADAILKIYHILKGLVDDWDYQNMASVLPPGNNDIVDDGSATDGRNPITADDCYALILRANEIIQGLEANNKANLASIIKVSQAFIRF